MTAPASTICCHGCGYIADPADPCPFRCPRAGTDDADHVLTRVLSPAGVRFPSGGEVNPFLRYRALMHSHHAALAHGLPDAVSWPSPVAGTRPWRQPWWPGRAAGG